jgi:signal transduction histidine kinase
MKPRHKKSSEESSQPRVPRARAALGPEERDALRSALHGGLGQLLTSISFLATTLRYKLEAQELAEADDAEQIIALTRRAISETQALVQEPELPQPRLPQ